MDNPGEILRLCRLCLVKDQVNIPIFEEQGDIRQTFLKIRSCLPVKVSRDDKLPKKICGGCSNKLDLFYEFWSSTANSEKTLQSWLGQEEEDDKMQEITKPVEALVKEESEALDDGHAHDQSFDEATKDEAEAPPAKRARRTAAVKAQINISHDSDEDEDVDGAEPITKIEDESDDSDGEEKDPSYTEVPGTSADDQAGPSGLGKDGVEAPSCHLTSKCSVCSLKFNSKQDLRFHWNQVIVETHCQCISCGLTNQNCDHPVNNKIYNCSFCNAVLDSSKLKQHKCFHGTTSYNKIETDICVFCSQEVPLAELKLHEDDHKNREKLKSRQKKNSPKQGVTICTFCGVTVSYTQLKTHERTHRRLQVGICSICGFRAKNIYQHMVTHRDERRFPCEKCGLAFKYNKTLKVHMLVHDSVGKFKCETCGKAFKTAYNLKVHMRSHQEVKPFGCQYCERTFTTKQSRDNHTKIHIIHNS